MIQAYGLLQCSPKCSFVESTLRLHTAKTKEANTRSWARIRGTTCRQPGVQEGRKHYRAERARGSGHRLPWIPFLFALQGSQVMSLASFCLFLFNFLPSLANRRGAVVAARLVAVPLLCCLDGRIISQGLIYFRPTLGTPAA